MSFRTLRLSRCHTFLAVPIENEPTGLGGVDEQDLRQSRG